MGQRVCPSQRSMGTQKSARYAYELESSSVKEAATIVWTDPCMPPTRCQARSWGQGQPTLMNRCQRGGNNSMDRPVYATYPVLSTVMGSRSAYAYESVLKRPQR